MGRVFFAKTTVEESLVFSIYDLRRIGVFDMMPGCSFTLTRSGDSRRSIDYRTLTDFTGIALDYTWRPAYSQNKGEYIHMVVTLETTDCYFGGKRYWFRCPLIVNGVSCYRRVAKLYLPSGSKYFGCRHCHNLSYQSRQTYRGPYYWAIQRPIELLMADGDPLKGKTQKQQLRMLHDIYRMEESLRLIEEKDKRKKKRKRRK